MASCITSKWGDNYSPQVQLTVNQSSSNGGTVTFSWTLQYIAGYKAYTNGNGRFYSVVIDGSTVKSGTYDINQKVGTYTIASGSKTVNKSTSSRNVSFSCSFNFDVTWAGSYSGTRSASGSISISAKESHTVSYNANGGSGAPSSQTKWWGTILTLSSSTPTRTGHTFQGWATSASGSVAYQPGGQYGLDQNVTLYAVWRANTYTVSYNANGGSGAPGNQTKTYGVTLTLSTTKPTRTNYNFKGWGTSAGSTSVAYASGASYTANASITLYAVWELAYVAPRISNAQAVRATSDGTETDTGTYLKVKFSWSTDRSVSSIKVQKYNGSSWTHVSNITASGTSGTVSSTVAGGYDTETSYQIRILVSDNGGTTYSPTLTLPTMQYIIDFKAGGKGVAFGKVADTDNQVEFAWPIKVIDNTGNTKIRRNGVGSQWIYGRDNALIGMTSNNGYSAFASIKTSNGSWDIGAYNYTGYYDDLVFTFIEDSKYNANVNDIYSQLKFTGFGDISLSNGWLYTYGVKGWFNQTYGGGIHMKDSTYVRVYNGKGFVVDGNTHLQNALCTVGTHRFTSQWLGFYGSISNAQSNTNRKGWIGHNSTENLYIVNQAGASIELQSTESVIMKCSAGGGVEIFGSPCFIDFHHNNSYTDYTHRLLSVSGSNIYAYPGITNASDKRLKKDIESLDDVYINVLKELKTKTYRYKKNDKYLNIGLIAQDVLETFEKYGIEDIPIVIQNELDEMYGVDYSQISSLLVYGWQKQQEQLIEQQSVIDAQQKEIDDLKSQVQELKELVLAMSKKEE